MLAFIPSKITQSYGVDVPNANYEFLLRHRAILLGIIGGVMIYAALTKKNYPIAVGIGLISMVSFVILYLTISGDINAELIKVMKIDIAAIVILLIGYVSYKFK